jgi:hypothetical protein
MQQHARRLVLSTETVRALQESELQAVVGGTDVVQKENTGFRNRKCLTGLEVTCPMTAPPHCPHP